MVARARERPHTRLGEGGKEGAAGGRGGGRSLADRHDGRERARCIHRKELVAKRKEGWLCEAHHLTNPGVYKKGAYDMSGHIGPWTQWHRHLGADLRVIVQDWGGVKYFIEHKGFAQHSKSTHGRVIETAAVPGKPTVKSTARKSTATSLKQRIFIKY